MMKRRTFLSGVFGGEPVLQNLGEKNIRFVLFLFGLIILYISIHYAVGQTLVEGRKLERELKTLRAEYTTNLADLAFLSKQEEVSKRLLQLGSSLQAPVKPARRIIMEDYPNE